MQPKNLFYILTCLSFSVILGAAVYEHAALWPAAFSELPRSLPVFQGNYKLNSGAFWMPVHPVTLVFFIITLVISWKTERKKNVLIPMVIYVIVLLITFIYFVPELLSLIETPYADTVDEDLSHRASMWENLSLVRMGVLFIAAIPLYMGLTKPLTKNIATA